MAKKHDAEEDQETKSAKSVHPDSWIDLARIATERQSSRRALEWKLAFGFWAGIGSLTAGVFSLDSFHPASALIVGLTLVYIVLLLAYICWQVSIQKANADDREYFKYYVEHAKDQLGIKETNLDSPQLKKTKEVIFPKQAQANQQPWEKVNWWFWGNVTVTVCFLILSWIAIFCVKANYDSFGADDSPGQGRISHPYKWDYRPSPSQTFPRESP